MSFESKSADGEVVEMEMDGSGRSIQLEEEWKERKGGEIGVPGEMLTLLGSGSSLAAAERKMEELAASIKTLSLKDGPINSELISKLEHARVQSSEEKRLARKAAWIEEALKEVSLRVRREFRNKILANVTPKAERKRILENMEDPDDKASMSRTSSLCRELLKAQRTSFLFDMVFPLLYPLLETDMRSIDNLRGVCSEWKCSLESYLEDAFDFGGNPDWNGIAEVSHPPSTAPLFAAFRDGNYSIVREFVEQMQIAVWTGEVVSNSNPFPFVYRKLIVALPYHNFIFHFRYAPKFWNEIAILVDLWGEQIWDVQIELDMERDPTGSYDRLWDLLQQLPNLERLSINGESKSHYYDEVYGEGPQPQTKLKPPKDFYKALEKRITEKPLPDLPDLKTFVGHEVPAPLAAAILTKYNSTLESVSLTDFFGTTPDAFGGYTNLPHLKLFAHSAQYPSLTETEPKTAAVDWPSLEQASLMYGNLDAVDIPRLFQRLNQFGGTLRELTLELKKDRGPMTKLNEHTLKMLSLELPHLEEFSLLVYRINMKTMDFILPMTSLKKLTVVYEKQVSSFQNKKQPQADEVKAGTSKALSGDGVKVNADVASGEIIKFGEYTNRLYESNIWKLLPELKKVIIGVIVKLKEERGRRTAHVDEDAKAKEVKKKVYTREGYNEYCSGCSI